MKISGISENRIARFAGNLEGQEIIIAASPSRADRIATDLSFFSSKKVVVLPDAFPEMLSKSFKYDAKSKTYSFGRMKILSEMIKGDDIIVVAPVISALQKLPSPKAFKQDVIMLDMTSSAAREELISKLVNMGYVREELCEAPGQFAIRGDIFDIFAIGYEYPIRAEFFDTEIDAIRAFDPYTQRSLKNIDSFEVWPCELSGEEANLWDYLSDNGKILIDDPSRVELSIEEGSKESEEPLDLKLPKADYYFYPLGVEDADEYIETRQAPIYGGHMEIFSKDMKDFMRRGYEITIACSTQDRLVNLRDFLSAENIEGIILRDGTLSTGIEYPGEKKLFLTDSEVFPYTKKRRIRREKGREIKVFTDIKKGDYVVHEAHGVGRFAGVQKMSAGGSTKDYLRIEYAGNDVLYVPVDQMTSLQKYVGSEAATPRLNKLSSGEWSKTKERVKAAIKDMADEFLRAAAERQAAPGFAFAQDSEWQREFESRFPYEETDDQLKATEEIKADMQSDRAMDRLLCGDVGYGKTEVAARAIFKCLEQGKQAAMLVPTTVLASQHYHTFLARMAGYPFNIEMLSRFRSAKQQDEIINKINKGEVDLVIGTHRILSSEIEFKDLGLLVIDEEQRFGVEHKEKIKNLKKNVDVLTLSATPIPRTLNMSLTGIRCMSIIAEPPEDRFPVQTYVVEEDDRTIAGAIRRELARGGQVYIVYNRVRGIQTLADRIRELVPEASICVGHGQMGETALEDVMMDFSAGKYQILIATTIIESGLDIPNVNTMIIIDADKFGLAQLYQLRGRVGRTNRIAYAYLCCKKDKQISEVAEKRLRAIKEFTEFGSGFRIAMRDLEIRGAGNVLGVEQSGHMMSVGYELYCKLVDEAVRELKAERDGTEIAPVVSCDTEVNLMLEAFIPEDYIHDEIIRLDMYKSIAGAFSFESRIEIEDELVDRFGDIPDQLENLIDIAMIHNRASKLGVKGVYLQRGDLIFIFDKDNGLSPEKTFKLLDAYDMRLTIYGGTPPKLSLVLKGVPAAQEAINMLELMV